MTTQQVYRAAVLLVFAAYCGLLAALSNGDLAVVQHWLAPLSGRRRFRDRPCGAEACVVQPMLSSEPALRLAVAVVAVNGAHRFNVSAMRDVQAELAAVAPAEQLLLAATFTAAAGDDRAAEEACHALWKLAVSAGRWGHVLLLSLPSGGTSSGCTGGDYETFDRWHTADGGALTEPHWKGVRALRGAVSAAKTPLTAPGVMRLSTRFLLPLLRTACVPRALLSDWSAELLLPTLQTEGPSLFRPSFHFNAEDVLVVPAVPNNFTDAEFLRRALHFNVAPLVLIKGTCAGEEGRASVVEWTGHSVVGEPLQRATLVLCVAGLAHKETALVDVSPAMGSAAVVA
jgi:hypothetical protein